MNNFAIRLGFEEAHRGDAARLFMAAFGGKVGGILGAQGPAFITAMLQSDHAISAVSDGRLLGIAGFKTEHGAFVGGELSDLDMRR